MLLLQALLHASLLGLAFADNTINVVPLPTNVTVGSTVTCLSDDFRVVLGQNPPRDLKDAAARMISRIRKSQHRYLSVEYGAEFFQSKPGDHGHSNHVKCSDHVSELHLRFTDSGSIAWHATRAVEVRTSDVERYTLSVPANGRAVATGTTALGMFRALTTFENLWYKIGNDGSVDLDDSAGGLQTGSGGIAYAPFAPYDIRDEPLFPWRSVMLDTSRHFFHKATLLRLLDTMAKVKLSVFHWHLTDSQTWPLELSQFPELAHKGSYQKRWYTESDVKEVIAYAAARGIDVVVEIDTPGHSQSIGKSHPEYITCVGNWGTRGQLRWADPAVVDWTSKVLLAAASITQSKYFGTGGDEVRIPCMEADAEMQRHLRERNMTLEESFSNFTLTNNNNLIKAGHSPVVWEEIILDHNVPLDKATIVNAWVNYTSTQEVADKGYRFVHAWSDYFYLDCGAGLWVGNNGGASSWCDPFKSWQRIYAYDPYANLTETQASLAVGGQVSLWAEQTDENNVETTIWPRAAALAEVFWTGAAGTANGTFPRSSIEAFPRMHDIRYRIVDSGVRAAPLQPEYCALRPGACNLPYAELGTFPL